MRTILLTPYQNKIDREYLSSDEISVLCDTTDGAFTATMPDSETSDSVVLNVVNIGVNILTVSAIDRQNINDSLLLTLKQWDVVRLIAFESKWIVIGKKTNRFGNEANYTEFESNGFMRLVGDARGYDDIIIGIAAGKVPAVNYPDWTPFTTNLSAYSFKIDDRIDLATIELLHDSEENQTVSAYLHWATNGTNVDARYIKVRLYYTIAKDGTVFPDDQYIESGNILIPANTAHRTSFMSVIGNISLSGFGIGTQIKTGIRRVAATTGSAPTGNPFLGQIGIHRIIDTPAGSRDISTK